MTRRVCTQPGCPTLVDTGRSRCPAHTRELDAARGRRQARGYGAEHDRLRAAWAPQVKAGLVHCRRCDRRLTPTEPWDLGHPDAWCPKPTAPECISCNRATAGRYTA